MPINNEDFGCDVQLKAGENGYSVSLNLNFDIDPDTNTNVVANQSDYWAQRESKSPAVAVTVRRSVKELVDALKSGNTTDQIIYFYCHAQSVGLGGAGPDASTLTLGRTDTVTLRTLRLEAPTDIKLRGAPLVFLNACESGELSPLFYSGFVPYFMSKGARGVIGTECKVPVLFAAEWARCFFDEFLDGTPIGELVLAKRRHFYLQHSNLLGLLYGIHCNADTSIIHKQVA
jgi:hypothetical protein